MPEPRLPDAAVVLDAAPDATIVIDRAGRIVLANRRAEELFGYSREELLGHPVEMLVPDGPRQAHVAMREAFTAQPRSRVMGTGLEPVARRKDGTTVAVDISLAPLQTVDGPLFIAAVRDVSSTRSEQAHLRTLALHDPLTGLPNRVLLLDRLDVVLSDLDRHGGLVAVFYVDLDRFKSINDTFGHHVGDVVLVEVAARLTTAVRPHDTVARLGGDEFVVVCGGLPDEHEVAVVAGRLEFSLHRPVRAGDLALETSASVGVALTRSSDEDASQLLRAADAAMYAAKNAGPGRVQLFGASPVTDEVPAHPAS